MMKFTSVCYSLDQLDDRPSVEKVNVYGMQPIK